MAAAQDTRGARTRKAAAGLKTILQQMNELKAAGAVLLVAMVTAYGWGYVTRDVAARWTNLPDIQFQQQAQMDTLRAITGDLRVLLTAHADELTHLRAKQDSAWAAIRQMAVSVGRFSIAACMVIENRSELECRRRQQP